MCGNAQAAGRGTAPTPDVQTDCKGSIAADPETLRNTRPEVFRAGDIVSGSATVILAMATAGSITAYLGTGPA